MKTVGIIAEYNPFHKGHAYQLEQAKKETGADYVIVIMSGSFVQRGTPALIDKYTRAHMALACGADLVLELPTCYATGSAEYFAGGAVSLLSALNCVDFLCFGSESGNLDEIQQVASLLAYETDAYQADLKLYLKQGFSFPVARSMAFGKDTNLLESPNNTLGVEYCRALMLQNSSISPCTIQRISAGYHDTSMTATFSSATAIRQEIFHTKEITSTLESQIPEQAFSIFKNCLDESGPLFLNDFSALLHYKLLSVTKEELSLIQDMNLDLCDRIWNHRFAFTSFSDFADLLKTKNLTHTRITRVLSHLLLGLTQSSIDHCKTTEYPVYARVLGLNKKASPLFSRLKENSDLPLITKASLASSLLSKDTFSLFQEDIKATHIYESIQMQKYKTYFENEYTHGPIFINRP